MKSRNILPSVLQTSVNLHRDGLKFGTFPTLFFPAFFNFFIFSSSVSFVLSPSLLVYSKGGQVGGRQ